MSNIDNTQTFSGDGTLTLPGTETGRAVIGIHVQRRANSNLTNFSIDGVDGEVLEIVTSNLGDVRAIITFWSDANLPTSSGDYSALRSTSVAGGTTSAFHTVSGYTEGDLSTISQALVADSWSTPFDYSSIAVEGDTLQLGYVDETARASTYPDVTGQITDFADNEKYIARKTDTVSPHEMTVDGPYTNSGSVFVGFALKPGAGTTITLPETTTVSDTYNAIISGNVTPTSASLSDGTASVTQTLGTTSYDSQNDETTIPITTVQGNLPFGTDYVVEITLDDASVITSTINLVSQNFEIDLVDPHDGEGSAFQDWTGATPQTGWQLETTNFEFGVDAFPLDTTAVGTFQLRVWQNYTDGWTDWASAELVNEEDPLVASFTVTDNNLEVTFTDSSNYTGADTLSYSWYFGDGNTSTQQNPTHTYATEGTYSVELTVTDGTLSDTSTQQISVVESAEINLSTKFVVSTNNLEVSLTSSINYTGADTLSYSWDFGDGNTSTEENPTHTYNARGFYTITLEVTDGTLTDSYIRSLEVPVRVRRKAEPSYKAKNVGTNGTITIDGIAFTEGKEVDVMFKSKNMRYAEKLGLISVNLVKTEAETIENLESYIQEKYEGGLAAPTNITFSIDPNEE